MVNIGDITKQNQATVLPVIEKVLISRDNTLADGVQVISGISFKPTYVQFYFSQTATVSDAGGNGISYSNAPGDNQCVLWNNDGVSGDIARINGYCVWIFQAINIYNRATVTAFNTDGIDLTWTKVGSPTDYSAMSMFFFK